MRGQRDSGPVPRIIQSCSSLFSVPRLHVKDRGVRESTKLNCPVRIHPAVSTGGRNGSAGTLKILAASAATPEGGPRKASADQAPIIFPGRTKCGSILHDLRQTKPRLARMRLHLQATRRESGYVKIFSMAAPPGAVPFGTPYLEGLDGGEVSAWSQLFNTDIDTMAKKATAAFDGSAYLHSSGPSRAIMHREKDHTFFTQGDPADRVFYLHKGRVKISVVSPSGREATIRLVAPGEFFGERAMADPPVARVTTATAISACTALSIARPEFLRVMREEQSFSYLFSQFLLANSLRTQADLVDQLFNRAEKRLARLLLTLAEHSHPGEESPLLAPLSQEALASMIGSTRPRVNTFMTRFRKLGFIEYNGRIRVHKSLLTVFLRD